MLSITAGVPAPVLCTGLKHPSASAAVVIRGSGDVMYYAAFRNSRDASGNCLLRNTWPWKRLMLFAKYRPLC